MSAIDQFRAWESALGKRSGLTLAEELRDSVVDPATADADHCWAVMWNKPLYSNTFVQIADRCQKVLEPVMPGAWRFIGTDPSRYNITFKGGRNKVENYDLTGSILKSLPDKPKIAPHRLFAIQGAASFLRKKVAVCGEAAPLVEFCNLPLSSLVNNLRHEMGRGWAHITVLHMLTDFGVAIKPDLHLVRTYRKLNLLTDLKDNQVPTAEAAVKIFGAVKILADKLVGGAASPAELRYVDKVLMEVSRQGLL